MYKDYFGNDMKEGDIFVLIYSTKVDTPSNIFRLMVSATHYRIVHREEFPHSRLNLFEYQSGLQNQSIKRIVIPKEIVAMGYDASVNCLRLGGYDV